MRRLTDILKVTGGMLVLGIFVVVGMKSCIVTIWSPPPDPATYIVDGADGRSMAVILLPSRDVLISYSDPAEGSHELVRAHFRGTVATHYIAGLWNVNDDGSWFGLRRYARGVEPVSMEVEILRKSRAGPGETSFPRIGDRTRQLLLFTEDSLKFAGTWLRRASTDAQLVAGLEAAVPR